MSIKERAEWDKLYPFSVTMYDKMLEEATGFSQE